MILDWLEQACPALDQVVDSLGVLPDFNDELQRQIAKDLADELRRIARMMDKAARA